MQRDRKAYLWDILRSIEAISAYVLSLDLEDFLLDGLVQAAVERKLEIIGEAMKQMEAQFPGSTANFPQSKAAIGMRNRLAHGYFDTDPTVLWNTLHNDLPGLQTAAHEDLSTSEIELPDDDL